LPITEHNDDTGIIVVEINGQTVGVTVDAVTEVVRLSAADVEDPPASIAVDSRYINGVGKIDDRLIILLDSNQVLTAQEEIAVKQLND